MWRTRAELTASELLTIWELEAVANNSVIYKSNSWIYTELALWANWTVLTSAGATSAPTFSAATVWDVVWPWSSTDHGIARYDLTTWKLLQNSDVTIDDSNNMIIPWSLDVKWTTTTIDSITLLVADKNIEMWVVATPSDATANWWGITLKWTTDKTIIWDNANDNWTANKHWNIATWKSYKINNVDINTGWTLSNIAYLDQANIFTDIQTINSSTPWQITVKWTSADSGDAHIWSFNFINPRSSASVVKARIEARTGTIVNTGGLHFYTSADGNTATEKMDLSQAWALTVASNINTTAWAYLINWTSINTGWTLSNIAYLDQDNAFTWSNTITSSTNPLKVSTWANVDLIVFESTLHSRSSFFKMEANLLRSYGAFGADQIWINENSPTDKLSVTTDDATTTTGISTPNGMTLKNKDTTDWNYTSIQNRDADWDQNASINFINVSHANNHWAIAFSTRSATWEFAEKMFLNKDGKLWIGSSAPSNILHVEVADTTTYSAANVVATGSAAINMYNSDTTDNTFSGIKFATRSSSTANSAIASITPSANNSEMAFIIENAWTATEAMRINSTGKLWVWTATPSANADLTLEGWVIAIKETTTPTADTNYGKVYTKTDNELYFQDWAWTESKVSNQSWGWSFIWAKVTKSTQQSVSSNTLTSVTWNTETFDTDTIHNTVTNNSRLTCNTAWYYSVTGNFKAQAWTLDITYRIYVNWTPMTQDYVPNTDQDYWTSMTAIFSLSVNDYVEIKVKAPFSFNVDENYTHFSMYKIG